MAIFMKRSVLTESAVTTEPELPVYEGYVDDSLAGLQGFLLESSEEIHAIESSVYIQDILMEEAVFEGASTPEVLLEAFAQGVWDRLKKVFTALGSKIKAWYAAAIRQVQLLIQSGEKFISTYGEEIKVKDSKGFKYTSYAYDIAKGSDFAENLTLKVVDSLNTLGLEFSDADPQLVKTHVDSAQSHGGDAEGESKGDSKEKVLKALGHEKVGDAITAVKNAFRGGDKKVEISDFSSTSKNEMVDLVGKGKGILEGLRKAAAETEKQNSYVLKAIDRARGAIAKLDVAEDVKGRLAALASRRYNTAHFAISLGNQISGAQISSVKEALGSFERTLKSFVRWNPKDDSKKEETVAKENTVESEEATTESVATQILNSAQAWL
jgi:hypothetical protein